MSRGRGSPGVSPSHRVRGRETVRRECKTSAWTFPTLPRSIGRMAAAAALHVDLEVPEDLARLVLPEGVDRRLQALLDKQDRGDALTDDERVEAEGLVDLADLLALLRLRLSRAEGSGAGR